MQNATEAAEPPLVIKLLYAVIKLIHKIRPTGPRSFKFEDFKDVCETLQISKDKLIDLIRDRRLHPGHERWEISQAAAVECFGKLSVRKAEKLLQQVMKDLARIGKQGLAAPKNQIVDPYGFQSSLPPPPTVTIQAISDDSTSDLPSLEYSDDERFRDYVSTIEFEDPSPADDHMFDESTPTIAQEDLRPIATRPGYRNVATNAIDEDAAEAQRQEHAVFQEYMALVKRITDNIDAVAIHLEPRVVVNREYVLPFYRDHGEALE